MAELSTGPQLDPSNHLLLDQPLLRLPHELLRKNLKSAQRQIEITKNSTTTSLQSLTSQHTPADTLASLDATIAKAASLKRKLEGLCEEERTLHRQQKSRIEHLSELHQIAESGGGLSDVKYDNWSHVRLDRLLVDYLLRSGYIATAKGLAASKDITELVDVACFEECGRIERSLREGRTTECLAWCNENKQALKKMGGVGSGLELELRLQQFIELVRSGGDGDVKNLMEAIVHARKFLAGGQDTQFGLRAAGLLAHRPDTMVEPYGTMYSPHRYTHLATLFLTTHHTLFSLPSTPLLHIALSAGLSALKTPACHASHSNSTSPTTLTGAPLCPICSTELNELARGVPYAHHTKSFIEEDPVVLPNGRVYGRERLRVLNEKLGVRRGRVRDPMGSLVAGGDAGTIEWDEKEVRKVFIS